MSHKLEFRPAEAADFASLERLVNSAYRGESSRHGWTTEADLLDGQRTDLSKLAELNGPDPEQRKQQIQVASVSRGGKIVASIYLRWESPTTLYIGMLTVEPKLQGGGYGKQLLDRAESIARESGCHRVRMTVIDRRKELLKYYVRRGYSLTGASEPFPTHDPRFGIPKVEGLKLLELVKILKD